MSSYPINTQVTNFKINSEQDLFEINPSIPSLDNTNNDDNCEPTNCVEYNLSYFSCSQS